MSRRRAERVVAAAQRISVDDAAPLTGPKPRTAMPPPAGRSSSSRAAEGYLQQSGVQFLLEDLVKRLQDDRPEAPAESIHRYFAAVVAGTHVRGRAFAYVNGTLHNQLAFLMQLQRGLTGVDMNMEITSEDFAELVWNHCSDIPSALLNQANSHLDESPDGLTKATIQHFLTAFRACFIYNNFLCKVHDVYSDLVQASKDVHSSFQSSGRAESIASAMAADRVVARLRLISQQTTMAIPPLSEVESFVFKSTSFQEFCSLFFLSPVIATTIQELQDAFLASDRSQIL